MANRTRRRSTPAAAPTPTVEQALRRELQVTRDNLGLLAAQLREAAGTNNPFVAAESIADLERQIIDDPGWRLLTTVAEQEFSADGLRQIRAVCRLMNLVNPLIKRGLNLRSAYVWGQGCEIVARANGRNGDGEQDVQAVLSAVITDPANQRAVFGAQARDELEHTLGTDGELYLVLFTRPASGWCQARVINADEMSDPICNPDDAAEVWFYPRRWTRTTYDHNGTPHPETQEVLYPDVDYKPTRRPATFAGVRIAWDSPVIHVAVNRLRSAARGVPDAYAAVNWARAYKEFLEQWSGLMKSLARFAWRMTVEGRNRTQTKAALAAAAAGNTSTIPGERNDVGGVAMGPVGAGLEAIPKTGATIDAESGRPIAMQVAAALDLPVTMLLADPGQTGARATAETLDWPTELAMMARQSLWTAVYLRICRHIIVEAVRATRGPLKGTVKRDPVTGREVVALAGDTDTTVDVVFPPLDEQDPKAIIDAVVAAAGTGTVPPELILRLALQALGVRDAESILAEMVDDDGNFLWPKPPAGPGQQAADLARGGGDPAAAGTGPMGPDDDGVAGGQPGAEIGRAHV